MIKTVLNFESPLEHSADCLVVLVAEGKKIVGVLKELDQALHGAVSDAIESGRFEGKVGQTILLNSRGMLATAFVLLTGLGKIGDMKEEAFRKAAGTAARLVEKSKFKKFTLILPKEKPKGVSSKIKYDPTSAALAEGIYLSLYHFEGYKSLESDDKLPRIEEIGFLTDNRSSQGRIIRAIDRARAIAEAVCAARDLIHHPGNIATPSYLAGQAKIMAKKQGVLCKVLEKKDMEKQGMGALLGVTRGSNEAPKFIILEYTGGRKKDAPIVVIGKGITFDTGGVSLKPSASMDEMKMDMSGAAAAIGVIHAVAALQLKLNLVSLIPAAENMPDGLAIKPGDILKSLSGKTIEVLNTDAEGRLVLCDALTYAQRYKPKAVIDLATLTGAVLHALGHHFCAALGTDSKLIVELKKSGITVGERVWELPLTEEYEKAMKSSIADLKNIAGPGVGAGTITGAAFLKAFAGDQPWVHLDIAGVAWSSEDKPYVPKGAGGFGVRLLLNYLENQT